MIMPDLFDSSLTGAFSQDKEFLKKTALPIITVSAVTAEDVKASHNLPNNNQKKDIVFSRAHFSMPLAVAKTIWINKVKPESAWIVDPTNYVSSKEYVKVASTELIGKTIARNSFLRWLKESIDKFGRKKLPIIGSIINPLLFLTQEVQKPFLSFHITAGNILLQQGKNVLQVITDPHVRADYLQYANNPNLSWCVFDEATKVELLEKASLLDTPVEESRIYVTGPPIDPVIVKAGSKKQPWRSGNLKLCLTTGGLGTNSNEILAICSQLMPKLAHSNNFQEGLPPLQLLVYCGTHEDLYRKCVKLAQNFQLSPASLVQTSAPLRIIYHPQLTDANNLLLNYGFPWAHGFITKPSGDMAYDAVASGCFLLTLEEWGEWEHAIRQRFEVLGVARRAQARQIIDQLRVLTSAQGRAQSWVESAQRAALTQAKLLAQGSKNIIKAYENFSTHQEQPTQG